MSRLDRCVLVGASLGFVVTFIGLYAFAGWKVFDGGCSIWALCAPIVLLIGATLGVMVAVGIDYGGER